MIRVTEVKLSLDQALNIDLEIKNIHKYLQHKFNLSSIKDLSIYKKAIDARNKNSINFVYTIDFFTEDEKRLLRLKDKQISVTPDMKYEDISIGTKQLTNRPIIIGFGPSGIFSALIFS